MCGRYYVNHSVFDEMKKLVHDMRTDRGVQETGDIYPSQKAVVLTGNGMGLCAEEMRWGFPQYHQKGLFINARAETVLEKKTFRDSVLHRRCIIPAGRFYEWDSGKNKVTFFEKDKPILYMAGFYSRFEDGNHFVILTTQANVSVAQVHDRMPLILEEKELESWVYEDDFLEYALHKTPMELQKHTAYEQLSLFG